ncbi:MAG: response regulator [Deltaproteobacteria bacterium]|nr:MAG: response regulator [Deltaproteobacteria bacterium]
MDLFAQLRKMNLLLIDDDEWVRDSLRLFFESEGCKITVLETAEEGLDLIKHQYFDIIIIDFHLPGMDGIEFIKQLSTKQANSLNILITAFGNRDILSRAQKAGIQEFIAKPFTSEVIETSLRKLISMPEYRPAH